MTIGDSNVVRFGPFLGAARIEGFILWDANERPVWRAEFKGGPVSLCSDDTLVVTLTFVPAVPSGGTRTGSARPRL